MNIDRIQVGMVLRTWHDTGAMGPTPFFCRVLKVAKVRVYVRSEYGDEKWVYPTTFDRIMSPESVEWVDWK